MAFCDGKEDDKEYPKDVFRLREEAKGAHGLILGTSEYHGGVSGVLKNALDLIGFEELEGKMIGLVGVSGGALGAVHALSHLRTVGRAFHAWVIPEQAAVSEAWKAFDGGHDVRTRLRPPGDTIELLCEQVGGLFIATSAAVRPIVHAMTGFRQDCVRTRRRPRVFRVS